MPGAPLELEPLPGGFPSIGTPGTSPLFHQVPCPETTFIDSIPFSNSISSEPPASRPPHDDIPCISPFPHGRPYPIRATMELGSLLKSLTKLTSQPLGLSWFVVSLLRSDETPVIAR